VASPPLSLGTISVVPTDSPFNFDLGPIRDRPVGGGLEVLGVSPPYKAHLLHPKGPCRVGPEEPRGLLVPGVTLAQESPPILQGEEAVDRLYELLFLRFVHFFLHGALPRFGRRCAAGLIAGFSSTAAVLATFKPTSAVLTRSEV